MVGFTPCISTLVVSLDNNSKTWQPKTPTGYWGIMKEIICERDNQTDLYWHRSPSANPYQSINNLKSYWEQSDKTSNKWKALMEYIGFVDNELTVNYLKSGKEPVP